MKKSIDTVQSGLEGLARSIMLQWNDLNNNQHIEAHPWSIHNMSKSLFSSLHMYFGGGNCQYPQPLSRNLFAFGKPKNSPLLSIFGQF